MLRTVRLELARCHDFPEGSSERGYEFHVPLTELGRLDLDGFHRHRAETTFRRFWNGEEEHGHIRHDHRGWSLAFGRGGEAAETPFTGDQHRFTPGEYVSIEERDGQTRTFRVVTVH